MFILAGCQVYVKEDEIELGVGHTLMARMRNLQTKISGRN